MSENIFEEYKAVSKVIKRVKIDEQELKIIWPDDRQEVYKLKDLKKVAVITTDEGPFEPDVFWLMMFDIPIMVPDDDWVPGSHDIANIMLDLPNFNHELFIQAMISTENDAFEVWEKETLKN